MLHRGKVSVCLNWFLGLSIYRSQPNPSRIVQSVGVSSVTCDAKFVEKVCLGLYKR